jgi:hypothetical protein
MKFLLFDRLVEGAEGGLLVCDTGLTYANGHAVPVITLKVIEEEGRVFVEAMDDVKGLLLTKMYSRGIRLRWFNGKEFRLYLPWKLAWDADSFCLECEVLHKGRIVELPLNESRYPCIAVDKTPFKLYWEHKTGLPGEHRLDFSYSLQ